MVRHFAGVGHNIVSGESDDDESDEFDSVAFEDIFDLHVLDDNDPMRGGNNNNNRGNGDRTFAAEAGPSAPHEYDDNDEDDDPAFHLHHSELLYDANLDNEDEAWVYRYRRGGVQETVKVVKQQQQQQKTNKAAEGGEQPEASSFYPSTQKSKRSRQVVYKPRNSDAVLSCPCCFNIVCMDCQRHARYPNQFRAMYVLGIAVDWQKILFYDSVKEALVPKNLDHHNVHEGRLELDRPQQQPSLVEEQKHQGMEEEEEEKTRTNGIPPFSKGEYFAVECASCQTQVAALDMTDEVYHFHGCLESAAPS